MDEIGYIYGFTEDEVQALELYKFVSCLRSIKILSVFRISRDSEDFETLDASHPGYALFLIVNRTAHGLMQKTNAYRSCGSISVRTIKAEQELFVQLPTTIDSNRH
ncbi:MAG TPA: hypothetical protein VJW94_12145 [Candidatus Acidoferrum sp.]|nr:hypothetical protein [Candidatus Acidoferrum sp.]